MIDRPEPVRNRETQAIAEWKDNDPSSAVDILRLHRNIPGVEAAIDAVRGVVQKYHAFLPEQQTACREMLLDSLGTLCIHSKEWRAAHGRFAACAGRQSDRMEALVKLQHKIDSAKKRLVPKPPKPAPPHHTFGQRRRNGTPTDPVESEYERIRQGLVADEERLRLLQADVIAEEEHMQSIRSALAARERAVAGIVDALRSGVLSLLTQAEARNPVPSPIKPRTTPVHECEDDDWQDPLEVRLEPGRPVLYLPPSMLPKGARTRPPKQTPQPSADHAVRVVREEPTYTQIIVGVNGQGEK